MNGPRPVHAVLSMAAVLTATSALAACDAGGSGSGAAVRYVAEFGLGRGSPEEREFVLTPPPGPRVDVVPAPPPGSPLTPSPPDEEVLVPSPAPPATTPVPGTAWHFGPSVAWVNDGRYLGVVTSGSSSCPSGPDAIEVVAAQEIEIHLGPRPVEGDACTADMSGYVSVVELPQGVTPTEPLTARVDDHEVTIAAVAG